MSEAPSAVTFLFTDIEGSTRLWEQEPGRMQPALAAHDTIVRAAVDQRGGHVVKATGDGIHAAFDDPLEALHAALQIQHALDDPAATHGVTLRVRCGLHWGADERRDGDFFGPAVNRAARIMAAAHGGQTLLSQAVAERVAERLPSDMTLRDLGRVRLRDLSGPERVYQLLHPRLRPEFPPLRSLEATPNNLAQQLNSFVGREREMAEVRQLLAANRLVMLLGLGGIGKSRLSVQLGAELIDDYADGVWLVELAPLTDARLVPQALASVLGVKEEAGRPVMEALRKHVRDRQLLVILDNCEHVVHACADLAKQLLQAGPQLKVLASSREVLRVAGETVYQVPTLSAPEPGQQVSTAALAHHDAVRLFIDRVSAVQPAFALSDRNAAAVADICHRLDGIPLALELAAARARAMPVETLATRLSDRFRLLKTSDQTVLPRQRTLRALIDWSYDLLDAAERMVFQRLSVFAGGWTLEAAEAVCAGDDGDVDEADVLDLLSQLVEKSLVVLDTERGRYRMLETVRQYGQERLEEAGGGVVVRARHLGFHLALAEKARPALFGPEQGLWLARLDNELENFLAGHAAADVVPEGAQIGLRLVFAMRPYWVYRGILGLGQQLTQEALRRPDAQVRDLARCRGLFVAGQLHCFMGHFAGGRPYLEESLTIAREIDHKPSVAAALQILGVASAALDALSEARRYGEEALSQTRELGNQREIAAALIALAQLHRQEGRTNLAAPLYLDALTIARNLGDQDVIAIGLLNLAMVSIDDSRSAEARQMLLEALAIAEQTGSKSVGQSALEVCAGLAALRQQWTRAARLFGAAEVQATRSGLRRDGADEAFLSHRMGQARDALGSESFGSDKVAGGAQEYETALGEARTWLDLLA